MAAAGDLIAKMMKLSIKYVLFSLFLQFLFVTPGLQQTTPNNTYVKKPTPSPSPNGTTTHIPTTGPMSNTSVPATSPATTHPNDVPKHVTNKTKSSTTTTTQANTGSTSTGSKDNGTAPTPTPSPTAAGNHSTTTPIKPTTGGNGSTPHTPPATTLPTTTTTPGLTPTAPKTTTVPGTLAPFLDNHKYYTKQVLKANDTLSTYWIDIENEKKFKDTLFSDEYKALVRSKAVNVTLPFDVLYYGHTVRNVTLATGGFVHMNPFTHPSLTLTQNIAALMADLKPKNSNESGIFKANNDSLVVFEWRKMILHEKVGNKTENATFTFQLHISRKGLIRFVYKEIARPVKNISTAEHDVKAGISDGFRTTHRFFEYHSINVSSDVAPGVVIIFNPLPTCIEQTKCESCINNTDVKFNCKWCDKRQRCSDEMDRHHVDWITSGCQSQAATSCTKQTTTPVPVTSPQTPTPGGKTTTPTSGGKTTPPKTTTVPKKTSTRRPPCVDDGSGNCRPAPNRGQSIGAIIAVLILVFILVGLAGWLFYAYKNPTTSSGMCLMQMKTSCCKKGRVSRSSKDYQAFMESDTESLPL